ncbi:MAG: GerMN domain-containing protein [Chloroflexota bacterium]
MRQLFTFVPVLAVSLLIALTAPGSVVAQDSSVLTIVAPDGGLWALPEGQPPLLIRRDLGLGSTVTDLAWNPVQPELLVIRREMRGSDPYDSLLRVDLHSNQEEVLVSDVGPQARLLRPTWSPDGRWGIAREECCLGRMVVRFNFPTRAGSPNSINATDFLPMGTREITFGEAGFINSAGEIVMAVHCCLGDEPSENPAGLYAVPLNFQSGRRLAQGELGLPIGSAPDEGWLATLDPLAREDGHRVFIISEHAPPRALPNPSELPLSERGTVLLDGTIAVATVPPGVLSLNPRFVDVWALRADGAPARKLNESFKGGFTAFGFAPSSVLQAVLLEQSPRPTSTTNQPSRVFLSRSPDSETDFSVVFPVVRGPLTPGEAVRALISGPTAEETAAGYYSELGTMLQGESMCEADFELTIERDGATVKFCRTWSSAGIGQDARVWSQIDATLRQFPSIKRVRLINREGQCLIDMSGEDRCLRN